MKEIEKLPPAERFHVIDMIIRERIRAYVEIEKVWVREAAARWDAFERGEVGAVPYESVMAKYRDRPT